MAEITFEKDSFRGRFTYSAYAIDEDEYMEIDWDFGTFSDFMYYMKAYVEQDYEKLMDGCKGLKDIELKGISFMARQGTEGFSIDMFENWGRATMMFNESKFGDINLDKLKRIKDIINE